MDPMNTPVVVRLFPMRSLGASGVWELFVPGIGHGKLYKYEIVGRDGKLRLKTDPLAFSMQVRPETIFFGGGTPSALSTSQLEYLLTGLRERLDLSTLSEWTLEMNPATVSLEKAQLLREMGVNRISMGVQSWDEELLKVLGRVHNRAQAERFQKAIDAIKAGRPTHEVMRNLE